MLRFLNRVSLVLAFAATLAILVNRTAEVQAQGNMGSYAVYTDWDIPEETNTFVGFASAFETWTPTCDHSNFEFTVTLYSPTRSAQIMEPGMITSVGLPFDGETGDWGIYPDLRMHCSCSGSYSDPTVGQYIAMAIGLPHVPDPAALANCQQACQQGGFALDQFCRNINLGDPKLDKVAKAVCWSVRYAEPAACMGFCFALFGDW